ncbi:MAG: hypothetical protein AVDCRST_MAG67-3177 [uncultured Solirubrobacteraceae bacterium]|uniref:Response regulatory domain-containing protein n=1 Tax=uncultured Solirubrobacteraceae bacterium TaxID=1162706 RepID=A0A6J4TAD5_9ACTN|nr:MAG: hypothetical protein AVDCRST_MAG67-3177 [uncultured Solirubrobacteraceae bacterium]
MDSGRDLEGQSELDAAGSDPLAAVIRLRPIRTTVISPDITYRERAWTVLSPLGSVSFALVALTEPEDIAGLLREQPADVVVLDATGSERAAHAVIAALAETAPRTGVVVVCHHCTAAAQELGALPKWGWTQDLREGVELAYGEGDPHSPVTPRRRSPRPRTAGPLLGGG